MKRGRWADDPAMLHAHSTDGVIRTATLLQLGVAPATIVGRCLPGGRWQRILPGRVLLHNGVPTERQRLVAAMDYAGPDAIVTGTYALALLGYRRTPTPIHILLPHTTRRRSVGYVEIERTRRIPTTVTKQGVPIANPTRATIDAVRRSRDNIWCLDVLTTSLRRGDTSLDELAIELASCTTRGTAVPRRQLRILSANAASVGEVHAHALFERSGLPPAEANVDIVADDGRFIARPDLWIDDVALAWEVDSLAHHLDTDDHENTMNRRSRMQAAGIIVVSHLPRTIRERPDLVLQELRAAYATAAARPRPPVRIRNTRSPAP